MQMKIWRRLARVMLWILFIALPVACCLLFIWSYALLESGFSYVLIIAQPPLNKWSVLFDWVATKWFLRGGLLNYGWPTALAMVGGTLFLLSGTLAVRFFWPNASLITPQKTRWLPVYLGLLLLLAYFIGCVIHLLLPTVFYTAVSSAIPPAKESYWWPYYGWPLLDTNDDWTIYPPNVWLLSAESKAICLKLGALLAVLITRFHWQRLALRNQPKQR